MLSLSSLMKSDVPIRRGPPKLQQYRDAAQVAPCGAPEPITASDVWQLLQPPREERDGSLELADLCTPLLRQLSGAEREVAETTAKQALVVVLDAAVRAGRDRRPLYSIAIFDALAERWSPTYRAARPARRSNDMLEATLKLAKRELVERGVNRKALWRFIRDGVQGLFEAHRIGGRGHTRGRSVGLTPRHTVFREFERLVDTDKSYRRPQEEKHLLLAHEPTPPLRIAKKVAGQREHDIIEVG